MAEISGSKLGVGAAAFVLAMAIGSALLVAKATGIVQILVVTKTADKVKMDENFFIFIVVFISGCLKNQE